MKLGYSSAYHSIIHRVALIAGFALFLWVLLKNAWVTEDAYILFRSLEQLFAGNGPVWNPHQRVQVFTSPLWFWLLSLPRVVSSDVFLNAILISVILCLSTLFVIKKILNDNIKFIFVVLLLSCSNGFFDYTTSGLENPLGYFLITLYLLNYYKLFAMPCLNEAQKKCIINNVFFLFGLLILTRHDLSVLLFLSSYYVFLTQRNIFSYRSWFIILSKAFCPFLCWSLFSLIYYGTIFPNTAFAKLNSGIDKIQIFEQGIKYFVASLRYDFITLLIILIAIFVSLFSERKHFRYLGYGILANLIYIIYVGGDFMQGRFLSYAYLFSVTSLYLYGGNIDYEGSLFQIKLRIQNKNQAGKIWTAALLLVYVVFYPHTPLNSPLDYRNREIFLRVADERGFYFDTNSLFRYLIYLSNNDKPSYFPVYPWSRTGYEFSRSQDTIIVRDSIGLFGYWAGTEKIIIDPLALSDPLLARLPAVETNSWRIGQFRRNIPAGYIESIQTGDSKLIDSQLNEFYKKVKVITQSESLFSLDRLRAIIMMNLGKYNHYIDRLGISKNSKGCG